MGLGTKAQTRTFQSKDTKGKVKSSKRNKYNEPAFYIESENTMDSSDVEPSGANNNYNGSDDEKDDFDDLINDKPSFSKRLGINDSSEFLDKFGKSKENFWDNLSDDEEYQNMTEEERNEKMAPKLNLDGNYDFDSDEDVITSSTSTKKTKKNVIKDEEDDEKDVEKDEEKDEIPMNESDDDIPDFDGDDVNGLGDNVRNLYIFGKFDKVFLFHEM